MNKRKNVSAFIADITKGVETYYMPDNTKIPDHATHLLLYSKNDHGEHPNPVSVQIVDSSKPCARLGQDDCPTAVTVVRRAEGTSISVVAAKDETQLEAYVLHYGRGGCEDGDAPDNGHLRYLAKDEPPLEYLLPADGVDIPDGTTHILVFSVNRWGESKTCVSASWDPPEQTRSHRPKLKEGGEWMGGSEDNAEDRNVASAQDRDAALAGLMPQGGS